MEMEQQMAVISTLMFLGVILLAVIAYVLTVQVYGRWLDRFIESEKRTNVMVQDVLTMSHRDGVSVGDTISVKVEDTRLSRRVWAWITFQDPPLKFLYFKVKSTTAEAIEVEKLT